MHVRRKVSGAQPCAVLLDNTPRDAGDVVRPTGGRARPPRLPAPVFRLFVCFVERGFQLLCKFAPLAVLMEGKLSFAFRETIG